MSRVNWRQIESTFRDHIFRNGETAEVTLSSGEQFVLPAVLTWKTEVPATGGLGQEVRHLSFMRWNWHRAFPSRGPRKGDAVEVAGRKYAVDQVHDVPAGNLIIGYRVRLAG